MTPPRRPHHRRLRLRRRRRHPGRPQGLRRAGRVRHQRPHGGHRAEHPGCRRGAAAAPAHRHRAVRRVLDRLRRPRGEDRDARHPGDRGRGGRGRPGRPAAATSSSTRCSSPRVDTGSAWWRAVRAAAAVRQGGDAELRGGRGDHRTPGGRRGRRWSWPPRRWRPAARSTWWSPAVTSTGGEAVDVLHGGGVDHAAARAPGDDPAHPRHRVFVLGGDRGAARVSATRCRPRWGPPRSTCSAR